MNRDLQQAYELLREAGRLLELSAIENLQIAADYLQQAADDIAAAELTPPVSGQKESR